MSSSIITLRILRAENESLFLQYAIQAAIHAYRNDQREDEVNPKRGDQMWGRRLVADVI